MKTEVYNLKTNKIESIELNDDIFGLDWNNDLVYESIVAHRENNRQKIANTKGTSEVRGGGKKPWRQKGTGRARHGSIRSPLWRGGGVTFGPSILKNFGKKVNKKMKRKALFSVISKKIIDNEFIIVDSLVLENVKTKEGKKVLDSLVKNFEDIENKSVLFVLNKESKDLSKAFRNLNRVSSIGVKSLNIYDLLSYKYIVIDKDSVKELEEHFSIKKS
jgi:large subunit ribosomal protein L4